MSVQPATTAVKLIHTVLYYYAWFPSDCSLASHTAKLPYYPRLVHTMFVSRTFWQIPTQRVVTAAPHSSQQPRQQKVDDGQTLLPIAAVSLQNPVAQLQVRARSSKTFQRVFRSVGTAPVQSNRNSFGTTSCHKLNVKHYPGALPPKAAILAVAPDELSSMLLRSQRSEQSTVPRLPNITAPTTLQ